MTYSGFVSTALLVVASASGACASREVPSAFPRGSAAAPATAPVSSAVVTYALTSDPPLPGTPTEGWTGLGAANETAPQANHSHHHHGGSAAHAAGKHDAQSPAREHAHDARGPAQAPPPEPQPQHDQGAPHAH